MEEGFIVTKAVIALILKIANIIVHSIGISILRCLMKNDTEDVQMIYIVNLSATELIINATSFLRNMLKMTPYSVFHSKEFKAILVYSYIADYVILKVSLYTTMAIITIDRMSLIILNVLYPVYWNARKARCFLKGIWVVSFLVFIVASVLHNITCNTEHNIEHNETLEVVENDTQHASKCHGHQKTMFSVVNYVTVIFDFSFIVVAVISYGTIFHKLQQSQRNRRSSEPVSERSLWQIFRQSRFDTVLLLISTFIVFVIPPDLIWAFYSLKYRNKAVELWTTTSYALSYLSDGCIYIFMNEKVKSLLFRKIRKLRYCLTRKSSLEKSLSLYYHRRKTLETIPLSNVQQNTSNTVIVSYSDSV